MRAMFSRGSSNSSSLDSGSGGGSSSGAAADGEQQPFVMAINPAHSRSGCTVVRVGGRLSDWGAIDKHNRCSTCSSQRPGCQHVRALPDWEMLRTTEPLSLDKLRQELATFFDPTTGRRRLRCISWQQLPKDLEHGAKLASPAMQATAETLLRVHTGTSSLTSCRARV